MFRTTRTLIALALLTMMAALVVGCMPLATNGDNRGPVTRVDDLVRKYQNARRALADFKATNDGAMTKIRTLTAQVASANQADIDKVNAWRNGLEGQQAEINEMLDQVARDANGNPVALAQADLNNLDPALMGRLTLAINSVVEAPLPPLSSPEVTRDLMSYTSEAFDSITAAAQDWNTAVEVYNAERLQAATDVVASAANALGLRELPRELPYYGAQQSDNVQIGDPLPPTAAPER